MRAQLKVALALFIGIWSGELWSAEPFHSYDVLPPSDTDLASRPLPIVNRESVVSLSRGEAALTLADRVTLSSPIQGVEILGQVNIDRALLHAPPKLVRNADGTASSFGVAPISAPPFSITIGNLSYTFAVVDETIDAYNQLTYVTAVDLDNPRIHVRFTVDERSGEIAGTIRAIDTTYRIVPRGVGRQVIYALRGDLGVGQNQYLQVGPANAGGSRKTEVAQIKIDLLASIAPESASFGSDSSILFLRGGDLGAIPLGTDPKFSVQQALIRLAPLTQFTRSTDLQVSQVLATSSGQVVLFHQLINGIPLPARNFIITSQAGKIREISTSFFPNNRVVPAKLAQSEATDIAQTAARAWLAAPRNLAMEFASVQYRPREGATQLTPVYKFLANYYFEKEDRSQLLDVYVDGVNGDTVVDDHGLGVVGDQFRHRACARVSGPKGGASNPQSCSQSYVSMVYSENPDTSYTCYVSSPPNCNAPSNVYSQAKYKVPRDTIASMENIWETVIAGNSNANLICCSGMGDVHIVMDSNQVSNTRYLPSTNTIHVPSSETVVMEAPDVPAHELGHAWIQAYNPDLHNAGNQKGMAEGMADVFAAIRYEYDNSGATSAAWLIDEGVTPHANRDLKTSKNWGDLVAWNGTNEHVLGQIYGNFFYKVRLQLSSSDLGRLMELAIETAWRISDSAGDGFDLNDFYRAVQFSIRSGETTLQNAVNTTWTSMNNVSGTTGPGGSNDVPMPPGTPSPPSAPLPPTDIYINSRVGCINDPVIGQATQWSIGNVGSSGATRYDYFYRALNGLTYLFAGSSTVLNGNVSTNFSTLYRVRACNGNGCSALSNDSISVDNSACQ